MVLRGTTIPWLNRELGRPLPKTRGPPGTSPRAAAASPRPQKAPAARSREGGPGGVPAGGAGGGRGPPRRPGRCAEPPPEPPRPHDPVPPAAPGNFPGGAAAHTHTHTHTYAGREVRRAPWGRWAARLEAGGAVAPALCVCVCRVCVRRGRPRSLPPCLPACLPPSPRAAGTGPRCHMTPPPLSPCPAPREGHGGERGRAGRQGGREGGRRAAPRPPARPRGGGSAEGPGRVAAHKQAGTP